MEYRNQGPKHHDVFHSAGMDTSFIALLQEEDQMPAQGLVCFLVSKNRIIRDKH